MSKQDDEIREMVNESMELETPESLELAEFKGKAEVFDKALENNVWGYSRLGIEAKNKAMQMLSTKTGMYAKIPLYCKGEACPYAATCMMLKYGMAREEELCVVETAEIELRAAAYAMDFDLETSSFTDKAIVSEIINLDIMMERCKALMAAEGSPVIDVVMSVTEDGEPIMGPQVSKAVEAYEKFSNRKEKLYKMMLATRNDKKVDTVEQDNLMSILNKALVQQENNEFVIEERPDGV